MKITMLGTGNAVVTECYNTCFVLSENKVMSKEEYYSVYSGLWCGMYEKKLPFL